MPLDLAAALALAASCAPQVEPLTLLAVAKVESGFDSLAIGVNGPGAGSRKPGDRASAIREAKALIAAGRNIDLGLGQINVRNLHRLGLSVADAFDPCRNLKAAAQVLSEGFRASPGAPQAALRTTLSLYNTGDRTRGLRNGYVAKVVEAAAQLAPAMSGAPSDNAVTLRPPPAPWDAFARARAAQAGSFVLTPIGAN